MKSKQNKKHYENTKGEYEYNKRNTNDSKHNLSPNKALFQDATNIKCSQKYSHAISLDFNFKIKNKPRSFKEQQSDQYKNNFNHNISPNEWRNKIQNNENKLPVSPNTCYDYEDQFAFDHEIFKSQNPDLFEQKELSTTEQHSINPSICLFDTETGSIGSDSDNSRDSRNKRYNKHKSNVRRMRYKEKGKDCVGNWDNDISHHKKQKSNRKHRRKLTKRESASRTSSGICNESGDDKKRPRDAKHRKKHKLMVRNSKSMRRK